MIIQYYLSLYDVHFLLPPNYSLFKIRLINQQSGDFSDTPPLSPKLDSRLLPIQLKLRGTQKLPVRLKLIALDNKREELRGDGGVILENKLLDKSIRVPIIQRKQPDCDLVACTVDFLIWGHPFIAKHAAPTLKNNKKQEHQSEAYSQLSYTVESDRDVQLNASQLDPKASLSPQPKAVPTNLLAFSSDHLNQKAKMEKGQRNIFEWQSDRYFQSADKQSGVQDLKSREFMLKNSAYLNREQTPQTPEKDETNKKSRKQKLLLPSISTQSRGAKVYRSNGLTQLQTINQEIPNQNQKSSTNYKTSNYTGLEKSPKQSIQRPEAEIFELQPRGAQIYRTSTLSTKKPEKISLKHDIIRLKLKQHQDLSPDNKQQLSDQKMDTNSPKLVARYRKFNSKEFLDDPERPFLEYYFDLAGMKVRHLHHLKVFKATGKNPRSLQASEKVEVPLQQIQIAFTNNQKIVTFRPNCSRGDLFSETVSNIQIPADQFLKTIVKTQGGKKFAGVIGAQDGEQLVINLIDMDTLKEESQSEITYVYQLSYDATNKKLLPKANRSNRQAFYPEPQELSSSVDIKSRIKSLGLQPWAYAAEPSKETIAKAKEQISKSSQEVSSVGSKILPIVHQDSEFNNSRLSGISRLQKSGNKKEINQIKHLRNGNRNNYRFGDNPKGSAIKEMWEKLLIKKKIDDDENIEKKAYLKRKHLKSDLKSKKKTSNISALSSKQEKQDSNKSRDRSISRLYGRLQGAKQVIKVENWKGQDFQQTNHHSHRSFTLQINNIAISQFEEDDSELPLGKFFKIYINHKVTYFTEIIFNQGTRNQILWKLSGCQFGGLLGNQRLEIEAYRTLENKISLIGISSLRISKLHFLRNNHIINTKIIARDQTKGELTIGFEIKQFLPIETIKEEDQNTLNENSKNIRNYTALLSSSEGQENQKLKYSNPKHHSKQKLSNSRESMEQQEFIPKGLEKNTRNSIRARTKESPHKQRRTFLQ